MLICQVSWKLQLKVNFILDVPDKWKTKFQQVSIGLLGRERSQSLPHLSWSNDPARPWTARQNFRREPIIHQGQTLKLSFLSSIPSKLSTKIFRIFSNTRTPVLKRYSKRWGASWKPSQSENNSWRGWSRFCPKSGRYWPSEGSMEAETFSSPISAAVLWGLEKQFHMENAEANLPLASVTRKTTLKAESTLLQTRCWTTGMTSFPFFYKKKVMFERHVFFNR